MTMNVAALLDQVADVAAAPYRAAWHSASRLGAFTMPQVGSEAHLDPEAKTFWRDQIAQSPVYLEYGAGGSTVEASRTVEHVVSVETDPVYLAKVADAVSANGGPGCFHPVAVDIGRTAKWGRPMVALPTPSRRILWQTYSEAPWTYMETAGLIPNFVVVDGRFRVASILETFLRCGSGTNCTVMLDDFQKRENVYSDFIPFAENIRNVGRALVFQPSSTLDRDACQRALRKYQTRTA